jgi:hypothetical protein
MNTTLETRVKEREAQLTRFITFIERILRERGVTDQQKVESCHIKVKKHLHSFRGFSFDGDWGHSSHGGNDVKVWYDPTPDSRDKGILVLEVYWQAANFDTNDCQVKHFSDQIDWSAKLDKLMAEADQIFAEMDAKRTEEKNDSEAQRQLETKAKRLGIPTGQFIPFPTP